MKRDLLKSISSSYVLFFLNTVVAIFLTPYILGYVSKDEYGIYILCVDFLAWFNVLQFGTNKVIESKAAHQIATKRFKDLNISFNSSFFFQLLVGLLIIPLFYFIIKENISSNSLPNINTIILIFSISAGISVFKSLYSAAIIATKKIYKDNYIQIGINLLNYALIILLVPQLKIIGLALISLFVVFMILVRSHLRVKQLLPVIKLNYKKFSLSELKDLLSTGIYFTIGSIATILLVKIDTFYIGKEIGLDVIASFYITVKIFILMQKGFSIFINNFRPFIAQLYAVKDFQSISLIYNNITSLSFIAIIFVTSILMFLNKWFVTIWVGEDFFLGNNFSVLFGFAIALEILTLPYRIVLVSALYKIKSQSYFRLIEALLRITGILFLFNYFGLEIMPIMSIISSLIFGHCYFYFTMSKFFNQYDIKNLSSSFSKLIILSIILLILYSFNLIHIFKYLTFVFIFIGIIYILPKTKKIVSDFKIIKSKL